jgi:hypothetical protein
MKACALGLMLNFGGSLMKKGVVRVVSGLSEENLGVLAWELKSVLSLRRIAELCVE